MAITRETDFVFDGSAAPAGVTRSGTYRRLRPIAAGVGSQGHAAASSVNITWRPNTASALLGPPNSFRDVGWTFPVSELTPISSPGRVLIPAQTIEVRMYVTSTASNGAGLTQPAYTPRACLFLMDPAGSDVTLLADATGAAVTTRGGLGGVDTAIVTLEVSGLIPEGWVLLLQTGGQLTSPQPIVGSNTETYTWSNANVQSAFYFNAPLRARYDRGPEEDVAEQAAVTSRHVDYVRNPASGLLVPTDLASRIITYGRETTRVEPGSAAAVRSATFPRLAEQQEDPQASDASRQVVFRRPADGSVGQMGDEALRAVANLRSALTPADLEVSPDRSITYGRRTSYYQQPADDPVIDPTREIRVRVRDTAGAEPVEGALVALFRSDNNQLVGTKVSDASGEAVWERNSFDSYSYWVAAWDQDGSPLQQAVSERSLQPEAV